MVLTWPGCSITCYCNKPNQKTVKAPSPSAVCTRRGKYKTFLPTPLTLSHNNFPRVSFVALSVSVYVEAATLQTRSLITPYLLSPSSRSYKHILSRLLTFFLLPHEATNTFSQLLTFYLLHHSLSVHREAATPQTNYLENNIFLTVTSASRV